jgi:hypothetical protein
VVAVQTARSAAAAAANDLPDRRVGLDEAGPQIGAKRSALSASLNQLANWSS